jgi:isopentenyl-diphosphate delta-isomerase
MAIQDTSMQSSESLSAVDVGLHDTITAIASSDDQYYPIDKLDAHVMDIPHLAVSIFIFHENKLLLQRRAESKYHSGGLWTNSVCSHPRWQEDIHACADRRLREEIGLQCNLTQFATISYQAQVGELYERERVHCFVGFIDNPELVVPNPQEVDGVEWSRLSTIDEMVSSTPDRFTEWFKIYMHSHRELINDAALQ